MRIFGYQALILGMGLAFSATVITSGCGKADSGSTGAETICRAGFEEVDGICVPSRTTDTGISDDDGGEVPDSEIPDVSETCTDGERYCADGATAMQCQASSWNTIPCGNLICNAGTCVPDGVPITCTPGETLNCADNTGLLLCGPDGASSVRQNCPENAPACLAGVCREMECTPGEFTCEGNNVIQCNGGIPSVYEVCEAGCSNGACDMGCGGKTYVGCDFWAVDLDNYTGTEDRPGADEQQFAVTVSNPGDTASEITILGPNAYSEIFYAAPGVATSIPLPRADVNDSVRNRNAYQIQTSSPVTVHQFNPQNNSAVYSNDASLLLPANAIGTDYIVLGWPTSVQSSLGQTHASHSFMTIVAATEGNTSVTVTPPFNMAAGDGVPALTARSPHTFELTQGDVVSLTPTDIDGVDVTGTVIHATQPVSVFAGHECAAVPAGNLYCDHLEQQLMPTDTWGSEFILAKFSPRGSEPDVFRVLSGQGGTTITTNPVITGAHNQMIGAGEYLEFEATQSFTLNATYPVSVGQYMVGSSYPGPENNCDRRGGSTSACAIPTDSECGTALNGYSAIGDPAFMIVVPTSQFRQDYIVLTPAEYRRDFLNIVAPAGATVMVDGSNLTSPSATVDGWSIYQHNVPDGSHTVVSSQPFGLYAYGYDCDVSYAYPGGLNLIR